MQPYRVLGVEVQFRAPIIHPDTGAEHPVFELGGKLDVLTSTGIIEHKTTSDDIELGSLYWRRVSALDSQVSTYDIGLRALGVNGECLYDVIKKPELRPYQATPEASRKYTKEKVDKKTGEVLEPSRLYAGQREHDETPEEYEARILEDIQARPESYFARGEIVRLEHDKAEYARDLWHYAGLIANSDRIAVYPRNTDSCIRYKRECDYFDVCSGTASIDDDTRFRTAENAHEELEG